LKRVGIVTSGGDAPGMNAAIRAVVRSAYAKNVEALGFLRGWKGLITNTHRTLTPRSVGGILHLGGTVLNTSRSQLFKTQEGIAQASETLAANNVDGLVVIGGDGSFRGALELSRRTDTLIVGIPATIDNDVSGTEETVGFDTAVNTAMAEIDKIRDTAISHERIFIIEVMGRKRGFLATTVGLVAGAEVVLVPERKLDREVVFQTLKENAAKGKKSGIIVAAEGVEDTAELAKAIELETGAEVRRSILGYVQRGGNPTARSRLLASLFGEKAVETLTMENGGNLVGLQNGKIVNVALAKLCRIRKRLDLNALKLAATLAT
jgi:6-phosphofructokinase 1